MEIKISAVALIEKIENEIKILRNQNKELGRKDMNDAYAKNTMCLVGMYRALDIVNDLRCDAIYEDMDNYIEKHQKKTVDSDTV